MEEHLKPMLGRQLSLRVCLRVGSDGSSELSLLLTLGCVLNFAWRDVRSLPVLLHLSKNALEDDINIRHSGGELQNIKFNAKSHVCLNRVIQVSLIL